MVTVNKRSTNLKATWQCDREHHNTTMWKFDIMTMRQNNMTSQHDNVTVQTHDNVTTSQPDNVTMQQHSSATTQSDHFLYLFLQILEPKIKL